MGRFDALTQLENSPVPHSPSSTRKPVRQPETLKAGKPETLKDRLPDSPKAGIPESNLSGNHETLKTRKPESGSVVKAEKYSTQLEPSVIKRIKQYAIEHDIKDYEVVQAAITDYLARNTETLKP